MLDMCHVSELLIPGFGRLALLCPGRMPRDSGIRTRCMRTYTYEHFANTSLGFYTLSCRIGKEVASHAAVARSTPAEVALIHTMHEALRGYCP